MTDSDDDSSARNNESGREAPPWWHEAFEDDEAADGVGTAAQEAVKLAAAVTSWANDSGVADILKSVVEQAGDALRGAAATAASTASSAASSAASTASAAKDHTHDREGAFTSAEGAHDCATCENCPICQGVEVLRTVSPETAASVSDAMAAVTSALRQAMSNVAAEHSDADTDTDADDPEPPSSVQHIKVD